MVRRRAGLAVLLTHLCGLLPACYKATGIQCIADSGCPPGWTCDPSGQCQAPGSTPEDLATPRPPDLTPAPTLTVSQERVVGSGTTTVRWSGASAGAVLLQQTDGGAATQLAAGTGGSLAVTLTATHVYRFSLAANGNEEASVLAYGVPGDPPLRPRSGLWQDPTWPGQRFHITITQQKNGRGLFIGWLSYTRAGAPLWVIMSASGEVPDPNNPKEADYDPASGAWRSPIYGCTYDYNTQEQTCSPRGGGTVRILPKTDSLATLIWQSSDPDLGAGTRELQRTDPPADPNLKAMTGAWYSDPPPMKLTPKFGGQAYSLSGRALLAYECLYDDAGAPSWLFARKDVDASGIAWTGMTLQAPRCPGCCAACPQPQAESFTDVGALTIDNLNFPAGPTPLPSANVTLRTTGGAVRRWDQPGPGTQVNRANK